MKNTQFEFCFPLNNVAEPLGELTISGKCWKTFVGADDSYADAPYGFEVDKVMYKQDGRVNAHDVTGLYQYLLTQTQDGAQNFETAAAQHIETILSLDIKNAA